MPQIKPPLLHSHVGSALLLVGGAMRKHGQLTLRRNSNSKDHYPVGSAVQQAKSSLVIGFQSYTSSCHFCEHLKTLQLFLHLQDYGGNIVMKECLLPFDLIPLPFPLCAAGWFVRKGLVSRLACTCYVRTISNSCSSFHLLRAKVTAVCHSAQLLTYVIFILPELL